MKERSAFTNTVSLFSDLYPSGPCTPFIAILFGELIGDSLIVMKACLRFLGTLADG